LDFEYLSIDVFEHELQEVVQPGDAKKILVLLHAAVATLQRISWGMLSAVGEQLVMSGVDDVSWNRACDAGPEVGDNDRGHQAPASGDGDRQRRVGVARVNCDVATPGWRDAGGNDLEEEDNARPGDVAGAYWRGGEHAGDVLSGASGAGSEADFVRGSASESGWSDAVLFSAFVLLFEVFFSPMPSLFCQEFVMSP
jgi:hypothetical protein